MKHLMDEWPAVEAAITGSCVFFLLDFDGTLAAIRRDPAKAALSRKAEETLAEAVSTKGISVAVISGRSRRDIMSRVGIKGITYVGNHGFETGKPQTGGSFRKTRRFSQAIRKVATLLKASCGSIDGVIVEDKGLTISVHYRMASSRDAAKVRRLFSDVVTPYLSAGRVFASGGKKVLEVLPPVKWDKGEAALRLISEKKRMSKKPVLPVYIGDDITDETAFKAIGNSGLTVLVGRRSSAAGHYLEGTGEVISFIRRTIKVKKGDIR
ncbi:MAG TPA: trehalose-phosphatase [Candidatus Omnitrophota bacterium]|mgnify:CR=1 FL=1|nr:trehalose-phosphatase [Candidatus Omnitrophota bacterium]